MVKRVIQSAELETLAISQKIFPLRATEIVVYNQCSHFYIFPQLTDNASLPSPILRVCFTNLDPHRKSDRNWKFPY